MKYTGWIQGAVVSLACVGTLIPSWAMAGEPVTVKSISKAEVQAAPKLAVVDVALGHGGTLAGQVVDSQGLPMAGTAVSLRQNDREVAATTTDHDGNYTVDGLQGGVYTVVAGQGLAMYRLWAEDTAPPAARSAALIVSGKVLVRGNNGALYWLTNPWILASLIAAAITIPIVVHNNQPSGS